MKKQFLAVSALALAVMSGSALAAPQDVQFVGTVTEVTCDIKPEVNGTTGNYVQLGNVAKGVTGGAMEFALKADAGTGNGSCGATSAGKTATVSWIGGFNSEGLTSKTGTATDAVALISTVNASGLSPVVAMTSTTNEAEFNAANLSNGTGLKYKAQLKGGQQAGDYISSAAFLVQYN
ncbi:fimbrial protein PefA [Salmonella enterica]|nr:fimbrial protein PefA [Salmonella enterica]EFS4370614.1 fimbrial protein PefA [Salmonella enterica]EHU0461795.1 fimbrial protein PefA [Salmonella enterica]EIL0605918.1 fimbrial protein PefA [Salmonella enterica]ELP9051047.1 fimbrial protein PefA [Salmonella enterica]